MNVVTDNPTENRFELPIDESAGEVAAAYYRVDGEEITLTHTEVPPQFAGRGLALELAQGVFEMLRASGRKAVLQCPFMAAYYSRHPEYSDVVLK